MEQPRIKYFNHEGIEFEISFELTGVCIKIINENSVIGGALIETDGGKSFAHVLDRDLNIKNTIKIG